MPKLAYRLPLLLGLITVLLAIPNVNAESNWDYRKVLGPEECGECHKQAVQVWKSTKHYQGYQALSRDKDVKSIAKAMGIKRIKKNTAMCASCHFTVGHKKNNNDKAKVIAGVSCESCHTPSQDWLDLHSNFGGKNIKYEQENPEHRKQRLAKLDDLGMNRRGQFGALARKCYQCHLVLNAQLVNTTEHPLGSDFEFVAWSQGEIRHNFSRSESGANKTNVIAAKPQQRVMYVVGAAVALEMSLRALALAKADSSKFANKIRAKANNALKQLQSIQQRIKHKDVSAIISTTQNASHTAGNTALLATADKIAQLNERFAATENGEALTSIDPLLPQEKDYSGQPAR